MTYLTDVAMRPESARREEVRSDAVRTGKGGVGRGKIGVGWPGLRAICVLRVLDTFTAQCYFTSCRFHMELVEPAHS